MSRRITFKLSGQDLEVALALQRHVNGNLGVPGDLNQIVKSQFLRFMYTAIDTPTETSDKAGPLKEVQLVRPANDDQAVASEVESNSETASEDRTADDQRDTGEHAVEPTSPAPGVLADSGTTDDSHSVDG